MLLKESIKGGGRCQGEGGKNIPACRQAVNKLPNSNGQILGYWGLNFIGYLLFVIGYFCPSCYNTLTNTLYDSIAGKSRAGID